MGVLEVSMRRVVLLLMSIFAVLLAWSHAAFVKEVLIVMLFAMVFTQMVRASTRWAPHWLGVTLWLSVTVISVVLGTQYVLPSAVDGIREIATGIPRGLDILEQLRDRLQTQLAVYIPITQQDEYIQSLVDVAKDKTGDVALVVAKAFVGTSVSLVAFVLGMFLFILLVYSWNHMAEGLRNRLPVYLPRHHEGIRKFFTEFQKASGGLFRGIGLVILIFTPIYVGTLWLFGLSFGKAMVWGIVLGFFTGIPSGSVVGYPLVVVLGLWNFFVLKLDAGLEAAAITDVMIASLQTTGFLLLTAVLIHTAETKIVTPLVMRQTMGLEGPIVVVVLFGGVLLFGPLPGLIFGLFGLAALRAADMIIMPRVETPTEATEVAE